MTKKRLMLSKIPFAKVKQVIFKMSTTLQQLKLFTGRSRILATSYIVTKVYNSWPLVIVIKDSILNFG